MSEWVVNTDALRIPDIEYELANTHSLVFACQGQGQEGGEAAVQKVWLKDLLDGAKDLNREIILVFICLTYPGDVAWPLDEYDVANSLGQHVSM